jgi:hypothetical protein
MDRQVVCQRRVSARLVSEPRSGLRLLGLRALTYLISALAFHNAQLQATAFREEFDPEAFKDLTEPNVDRIHTVRAPLFSFSLSSWNQ